MDLNIDERENTLHQLIFGNNEKNKPFNIVEPINAIEPINNKIQIGGKNKNILPKIGGDNPNMLIESIYFQKINTLFIILFISILLAIIFMKALINKIFPEGNDNNFDDVNTDPSIRWKKIIKFTFIFIITIIVIHFLIFLIILLLKYFKIMIGENKSGISDFKLAIKGLKEMIWEYKDKDNKNVNLLSYYLLLFFVLVVMFLFYMIYTKLVKGYFNNLFYETVFNDNNPNVEDKPQPLKYLYQYSILIILMMLFVLLLLNYTKLSNIKILFIYNIVFVAIYVLVTLAILRYQLQKNMPKLILFIILLILLFIGYKFLLIIISKLINPQEELLIKLSSIEKIGFISLLIIFVILFIILGSKQKEDNEQ